MSTLSSIRAQIIEELLTINDVTDMDDETLHDAIQSLIDGYGGSGEIDVSGIVSYYQTAVRDAMEYVRKLGPKWVNNLVVTDTHYEARNCRNSAPILALMYSTGKFDKIIHMGDCIDLSTSTTDYAAFGEDFSPFNGKMLLAIGNHDPASNATVSPTREDYYNDFLSGLQGLGGTPENFNYYYDNTEKKIRYIVHMYSPSQDNANFVGNAITSLPSGWTYVVINHYPQELNSRTVTAHRIADTMNKRFGFFIDGHRHKDMLWTTNRIPEITMMSDCLTYPTSEDADLRVKDTDTEHAITILSIKPSTGEVKTYRIGAVYDSTLIPKTFLLTGENSTWIDDAFLNGQGGVDYPESPSNKKIYGTLLPLSGSGDAFYVYSTDGDAMNAVYLSCFSAKEVDAWLGRVTANLNYTAQFNNIVRIATTNADSLFGLVGVVSDSDFDKIKVSHGLADDMPIGDYRDLSSGWVSGYVQSPGDVVAGSNSYQYHKVVAVEPETTYRISNEAYSGSGGARIGFLSEPSRGFAVEHKQVSYNSDGYWEFTTPATAHYALISLPIADATVNFTTMYLASEPQPEPTYTLAQIEAMGYVVPNGTKQVSINENGTTTEDVSGYANASITVDVSSGGAPSGSIELTANGTYDVTDKASAIVNVSGGGVLLPANMAMGTYTATGSETYLVAEDSKLGDILGGMFFMDDLETLPTTGAAYTTDGVVKLKLDYSTKEAYRADYVKDDGTTASYSIANSRITAGKLEFFINSAQPLKAGATYTWVIFGKIATT